jgi:large subunit ribosomal protein L4
MAIKLKVLKANGAKGKAITLDPAVFEASVNVPAMHQVVTAQLAAARAGTAKTKTRAEVRGGGSKPWRQKGTGRARQGSIRAPQWTGGGIAHGPTGEQNHRKRVNKKVKRLALASALSDRAASDAVRVVSDFGITEPRTKDAVAFLDALELTGRKVLIVLAEPDDAIGRSFRNLQDVHLLTAGQLNVHDVLISDVVVFAEAALERIARGDRRVKESGSEPAGGDRRAAQTPDDDSDEEDAA